MELEEFIELVETGQQPLLELGFDHRIEGVDEPEGTTFRCLRVIELGTLYEVVCYVNESRLASIYICQEYWEDGMYKFNPTSVTVTVERDEMS